jgi:GTP-binding protein
VALNKIDALTPQHLKLQKARLVRAMKKKGHSATQLFLISAATGAGVRELLRAVLAANDKERTRAGKVPEPAAWHP